MKVVFAVLIGMASILAGCGDSADPDPTPVVSTEPTATATAEDPLLAPTYDITTENPFVIRGPFTPDDALDASTASPSRQFILEFATGDVFHIDVDSDKLQMPPNTSGAGGGPVWATWHDSESINVDMNGQRYVLSLDGTSLDGPTPVAEPPVAVVSGGMSPSGRFSTGTLASGAGGVVVTEGRDGPTWHISAAELPRWAPTIDLLAVHGNLCEHNVLIYEPTTRDLRNISVDAPPIPHLAWSADSLEIAAFAPSGANLEIIVLDVESGEHAVALSLSDSGRLIPIEWSPDGQRLIFMYDATPFVPCTTDWGGPSVVDQNFGGP